MTRSPPPSEVLIVGAITLIAMALRFSTLDRQSFWIDEYLWVLLGQKAPVTILRLPDGYPPLYGLLVHELSGLGFESDWWLRAPSAAAGVLAVPIAYLVGVRLLDRRSAFVGAALLAINPLAIWYSQEAGAYSLLVLCGLGSTLFLLEFLERRRGWALVAYGACCFIGFGLHYYFAFLVVAQSMAAVLSLWKSAGRWRTVVGLGALVALAFAAWVPSLLADVAHQSAEDSGRSASAFALPYTALTFVGGLSLGPPLRVLHPLREGIGSASSLLAPHLASSIAAVAVVAALGLLALLQRLDARVASVLLLATIPVLAAWLTATVVVGYRPRYSLTALPFALLWFASAQRSRFPRLATGLLVAFAALELIAVWQLGDPAYAREDNRGAVARIAADATPAAVVLVGEGTRSFDRYAEAGLRRITVEPSDVRDATTLARALAPAIDGAAQVWLVSSRPWTVDPEGRVAAHLASDFETQERIELAGVSLERLTRRNVP